MDKHSVIYVTPDGITVEEELYTKIKEVLGSFVNAVTTLWDNIKQLIKELIPDKLFQLSTFIEQKNTQYKLWSSSLMTRTNKLKHQVMINKPLTIRIRNCC